MLLLFRSTHDVIRAEKQVKLHNISCKVIPVPRSISSQCGMALEVSDDDEKRIQEAIEETGVAVQLYKAEYKR